jgi:hypothetical protein
MQVFQMCKTRSEDHQVVTFLIGAVIARTICAARTVQFALGFGEIIHQDES